MENTNEATNVTPINTETTNTVKAKRGRKASKVQKTMVQAHLTPEQLDLLNEIRAELDDQTDFVTVTRAAALRHVINLGCVAAGRELGLFEDEADDSDLDSDE